MPIERLPQADLSPEDARLPFTERILRAAIRDNKGGLSREKTHEQEKKTSPEAQALLNHRQAIEKAVAVMPDCPVKRMLVTLRVAGQIENTDSPTPRWALTAEQANAVCAIVEVKANELGIRPYENTSPEGHHNESRYTHYLERPLPVMLLLRAKIDQAYREATRSHSKRGDREDNRQRNKERQKMENTDLVEAKKVIEKLAAEIQSMEK